MQREFTVIVERDEDGLYVGSVPNLAGCHSQARSLDDLMSRMQEAIALSLEEAVQSPPSTLEFIGVQRVLVPA